MNWITSAAARTVCSLSWVNHFCEEDFSLFYGNYTAGQEKKFALFSATLPYCVRSTVRLFRKTSDRNLETVVCLWWSTLIFCLSTPVSLFLFISLFMGMLWVYFVFELTVLEHLVGLHGGTSRIIVCSRLLKKNRNGWLNDEQNLEMYFGVRSFGSGYHALFIRYEVWRALE